MHFRNFVVTATIMLAASSAIAEPAPKAVDMVKLYAQFKKAGYSSLDLMDATKRVTVSGVVLGISQSFSDTTILKVGVPGNSQEFGRLTAADGAQESKMNTLETGAKFKAVCDLAFSFGTQFLTFKDCVFQ